MSDCGPWSRIHWSVSAGNLAFTSGYLDGIRPGDASGVTIPGPRPGANVPFHDTSKIRKRRLFFGGNFDGSIRAVQKPDTTGRGENTPLAVDARGRRAIFSISGDFPPMDHNDGISLAAELQLGADRISNHILHSDLEWIDIEIEINELRERCRERAPDKIALFDGVYGLRFARLWEQWRLEGHTSWTWGDADQGKDFRDVEL